MAQSGVTVALLLRVLHPRPETQCSTEYSVAQNMKYKNSSLHFFLVLPPSTYSKHPFSHPLSLEILQIVLFRLPMVKPSSLNVIHSFIAGDRKLIFHDFLLSLHAAFFEYPPRGVFLLVTNWWPNDLTRKQQGWLSVLVYFVSVWFHNSVEREAFLFREL